MRYGVPYKGSKNAIAEWVYSFFPKNNKKNFYDLFAGGCAVTHAAMLDGAYKNYIINDIDGGGISVFTDAINGKFADENRWIDRETFYKLKDKEPFIKLVFSFGNNGDNYLYSKEVEPWKRALHYAYVYGDTSEFKRFGIFTDGTKADIAANESEYKQKYIIWYCRNVLKTDLPVLELQKNLTERIERNSDELRNYLLDGLRKAGKRPCDVDRFLGTNGMAGHYFGKSQWEFPTRENYIKLQGFLDLPRSYEEIYGLQELLESLQSLESLESLQSLQRLESLQSLQRLESLQRLQSLESLESLQRLQRLESLQSLQRLESLQRLQSYNKSYDEIEIKPDSVIYCDIPYRNTDAYFDLDFDYAKFYQWCEKQTEPVFISEYSMPEDRFTKIAEIDKTVLLCSGGANTTKECLFIPKHQKYDIYHDTLFEGLE